MRILVNNKEIIFNNIIFKNNNIHITNNGYYSLIPELKLSYDDLVDQLEESLDNYVEVNHADDINDVIETYFNYFKITSNPLIKKNMSSKIGNIILNNIDLIKEDYIYNLITGYKTYKPDKYFSYLHTLLNLNSIKEISSDNTLNFDDEYFSYIDFIFDYNLE